MPISNKKFVIYLKMENQDQSFNSFCSNEMKKICLYGSDVGGIFSKKYQEKVYFRFHDNICDRLHSQVLQSNTEFRGKISKEGLPWATKDLIFAFVRIMNGWVVFRNYANPTFDDQLRIIQQTLSPDFRDMFFEWQGLTTKLIYEMIQ